MGPCRRAIDAAVLALGVPRQPAPLPESLISADPEAFFALHVRRLGLGEHPDRYPAEVLAAYRRQLRDPGTVHAICEDYRAGATIDRAHDEADRAAGRRITQPLLVLWGSRGALPALYDDVLAIWRPWATELSGHALDASHFLVEDRPGETGAALSAFFS